MWLFLLGGELRIAPLKRIEATMHTDKEHGMATDSEKIAKPASAEIVDARTARRDMLVMLGLGLVANGALTGCLAEAGSAGDGEEAAGSTREAIQKALSVREAELYTDL